MGRLAKYVAVVLTVSLGTLSLGAVPAGAATAPPSVTTEVYSGPSVSSSPTASGCSEGCIYIASGNDSTDGYVTVISAMTQTLVTTIKLPGVELGPLDAYYVAATSTIWVSALIPSDIYIISTTTNKIIKTLSLPSPDNPGFMALAPHNLMFFADYDHGGYFSVNVNTYSVSSVIAGCGGQPLFIAYDPVDGMLYAPAEDSQQVNSGSCYTIINPKTSGATDVTLSSGASELRDVAVNPENGYTYISDPENDVVDVVNGSELVTTIPFADGEPVGVIYSSSTNEIYVTMENSNTVVPISVTDEVGSAITVETAPTNGCYISSIKKVLITYQQQTAPDTNATLINKKDKVAATVPLGAKGTTPDGCAES